MADNPEDLTPNEFPKTDWQTGKLAESLEKLFNCAVKETNDSITWYELKRKPKQIGGQVLRVVAIILAGVAGIIPVIGEIFQNDGRPIIAPGWATVALAIAGLLVLLDRFWGFTSAWVRFMRSQQDLSETLRRFQFEWEENKVEWENGQPTIVQAKAMIANCKTFVMEVHRIVRRETNLWASEFQNAVAIVDQSAKIAEHGESPGTVTLQVTNGDACQNGWTVKIDDIIEGTYFGKTAVLSKIRPSHRKIRVSGIVNGVERQVDKSVSVVSGIVEDLQLTLG
jgi:hypothetical protein